MKFRFSLNDPADCQAIHHQSLHILKESGITVHSAAARKLYQKHGASVSGHLVRIPEVLVEKSLAAAPDTFVLKARHKRLTVGSEHLLTMPAYGATYIRRDNQVDLGNSEDFIRLTKLNHINPLLDLSCPYSLEPFDIPIAFRDMYKFVMTLRYSDKPTLSITQCRESAQKSIRCAKAYFDSQDAYLLIGNINISSPLAMSEATGDVILVHAEENQPLMIACGSGLSGFNAPPMPASNLLLANTQILAGIVLAQIARPGLPVIYSLPLFAVNPKSASVSVGSPITALFTMAGAEMARFYHLPCRAGGNFTDAKALNYQSGAESLLNLLSTCLSGVHCVMHTLGMEDSLNTVSYEKYLLDETLWQFIQTFLKGFSINAVTLLADDIIKHDQRDNYISMRNLKLIRKQYPLSDWPDADTDAFRQKAKDELSKRLETYTPPDIDSFRLKILRHYLKEIPLP